MTSLSFLKYGFVTILFGKEMYVLFYEITLGPMIVLVLGRVFSICYSICLLYLFYSKHIGMNCILQKVLYCYYESLFGFDSIDYNGCLENCWFLAINNLKQPKFNTVFTLFSLSFTFIESKKYSSCKKYFKESKQIY